MKERIVIEDFVCNDNCKRKDCEVCFKERSKKEQVPETWEDLKELCKGVKDIVLYKDMIFLEREDLGTIEFYNDGAIVCNEYFLAENRTATQMWKFILSLTEKNNVVDRKR